jgi:hypothetical protein
MCFTWVGSDCTHKDFQNIVFINNMGLYYKNITVRKCTDFVVSNIKDTSLQQNLSICLTLQVRNVL